MARFPPISDPKHDAPKCAQAIRIEPVPRNGSTSAAPVRAWAMLAIRNARLCSVAVGPSMTRLGRAYLLWKGTRFFWANRSLPQNTRTSCFES